MNDKIHRNSEYHFLKTYFLRLALGIKNKAAKYQIMKNFL